MRASGWHPNGGATQTAAGTHNGGLNTSFSAMNNSLSQKWMNKKNQIGGQQQAPISNNMNQPINNNINAPGFNQAATMMPSYGTLNVNNQSLGAVEVNFNLSGGPSVPVQSQQTQNNLATSNTNTGASSGGAPGNTDLNKRLAEMKAKLAALKNQKQ